MEGGRAAKPMDAAKAQEETATATGWSPRRTNERHGVFQGHLIQSHDAPFLDITGLANASRRDSFQSVNATQLQTLELRQGLVAGRKDRARAGLLHHAEYQSRCSPGRKEMRADNGACVVARSGTTKRSRRGGHGTQI